MIQSKTFKGRADGPKLLVLGAIHGDEKCGTIASHKVMVELELGDVKLLRGQITLVPICNPRAYELDCRYVDSNLNRDMVRTPYPSGYEPRIANRLVPLIEDCDFLLDIHSYHRGGPPFAVINEAAPRYVDFAASLNTGLVISGWTQAYLSSAPKNGRRSPTAHIGTTECAYNNGAVDVTLECGQHRDPKAPTIAYEGLRRALHYLEMAPLRDPRRPDPSQLVEMTDVFYSEGDGSFAQNWAHLDFVGAGTEIARRADGTSIRTKVDRVVILPRPDAPKGDEWFYLGHLRV